MPGGNDPPARPEGRTYGVPRRRDEIITLLGEAYAQNDLDQSDFERRLELAEGARTIEELQEIIADFPSTVVDRNTTPEVSAGSAIQEDIERQVERLDGMSAPTRFTLLGDQHISLLPTEPRVLRTVTILGDSKVDLRPLSGMPGVILLKVVSLIGDTKIHVSRGTHVDFRLHNLLGDQRRSGRRDGLLSRLARKITGASAKQEEHPSRPGPMVVVTGFKLIGDTVVIED